MSDTQNAPEPETAVYDRYISGLFAQPDPKLAATLADMKSGDLPSINVSATEGKLLQVLALATGATRILEIGTLGGYSGIHFARALPNGGKLVTLELDPHHAEVAQKNFERAGVADKVEVRIGPAAETLDRLKAENAAPFDIVFIDADKDGYVTYLQKALPLVRVGGLILADNTLPNAVLTGEQSGATRYNAAAAEHTGLVSITIPVLRSNGLDGLTVSVKTG